MNVYVTLATPVPCRNELPLQTLGQVINQNTLKAKRLNFTARAGID